jgi:hypothetical protein
VYLWLRGCRGGAAWILALTGVSAAFLGTVLSGLYGFDDIRLSIFDVPSRHARDIAAPLREWHLITDFMEMLYLLGVAIVGTVAIGKPSAQKSGFPDRLPFLVRWNAFVPDWTAWPLLCATGLALLPMSMLGRMKSGGTANNFGLTDYFLAVGIALLFLRLVARSEFEQGTIRQALDVSLVLLLTVLGVRTGMNLLLRSHRVASGWPPPIQVAYNYVQKHPGKTYFPWHPLANLMGEGRYFHTAWGVMERDSAGFPVSDVHFRNGLPENLQLVATTQEGSLVDAIRFHKWDHYLLRRLPEFRCRVIVPELPGWMVLQRGPENCQPSEPGPR